MLKKIAVGTVAAGLIAGIIAAAVFLAGYLGMVYNAKSAVKLQTERIEELEKLYAGNYMPVDEAQFCDFDLNAALDAGVRYNNLQVLGAHNSFKSKPNFSMYLLHPISYKNMTYYFDSITGQLNSGLRCFEFDLRIEKDGDIVCYHTDYGDNTSHSYDFTLAMTELALWSKYNPNHLPITVFIEYSGYNFDIKNEAYFKDSDFERLDKLLREKFGESLMTPKEMKGDYESLNEMAEDGGFPTIKDTLGKVIFLNGGPTGYIEKDETMNSQAMFPYMSYGAYDRFPEHRAFIIENAIVNTSWKDIGKALKKGEKIELELNENYKKAVCGKYVVRTRLDTFPYYYEPIAELGIETGANFLSTDYPNLSVRHKGYVLDTNNKTAFLRVGAL